MVNNLLRKQNLIELLILLLVFSLALIARLYKIDIPLADHHSWRQADTAAVARNFIKEGWNFLSPQIDNMTYLGSLSELNQNRLFLVEPPIYQSLVAIFYRLFGINEQFARAVSIFFSLGSMFFIYLITKRYFGILTASFSIFFFAFLPYSIFYSRVVLPEPMIIFLTLALTYSFIRWVEDGKNLFFYFSLILGAIVGTQKVFPLFLLLPLVYLAIKKYSWRFFRQPKLWIFAVLVILPLVIWRLWISNFPEGIPGSSWLFNQGDIRFKGAFFWWIFGERIGKLILGYWGLFLLGLGLSLTANKKEGWFFHLWFVSLIIYACVFAAGNVTHDYYQIPFVPILSIFLARGASYLISGKLSLMKIPTYILLVATIVFSLSFSWREVRDFYNIQGGVDLAGRAVDESTPPNALILTGDSNDVTLLYNTNRYGWTGGYASFFPNTKETIEKVKGLGGSIYVTTKFEENSDFGKYMTENYSVIKKTNQYIIFSLAR